MGVYLLINQKEMKTVRINKEYKMYIRILENDDWVVEYDAENNQYRVTYFQDYHFVDEVLFDGVDRSKSIKNEECEHEWECIGTFYTGLYTIRHYKCTKCGAIESISLGI